MWMTKLFFFLLEPETLHPVLPDWLRLVEQEQYPEETH